MSRSFVLDAAGPFSYEPSVPSRVQLLAGTDMSTEPAVDATRAARIEILRNARR